MISKYNLRQLHLRELPPSQELPPHSRGTVPVGRSPPPAPTISFLAEAVDALPRHPEHAPHRACTRCGRIPRHSTKYVYSQCFFVRYSTRISCFLSWESAFRSRLYNPMIIFGVGVDGVVLGGGSAEASSIVAS